MLLMTAAVVFHGCGQSGTDATNAGSPAAVVTLKATFPSNGAVKSFMNASTASITVTYQRSYLSGFTNYTGAMNTGTIQLTPTNSSATLKLLPQDYMFFASSKNSAGVVLDSAMTAGRLLPGPNTVLLTFLSGKWTFTDTSGATATPIVLSDNTTSISGFSMRSFGGTQGSFKKAAFDWAQPIGATGYQFRYRFGNVSSALLNADHITQFLNGANNSSFNTHDLYNLTQKCQTFNNNSSCLPKSGDRAVGIFDILGDSMTNPGQPGGVMQGYASELLPPEVFKQGTTIIDPTQYFVASVKDGSTIAGNLLELNWTADQQRTIITTTVAKPAAKVLTKPRKAQSATAASFTNFSHTGYDIVIYSRTGGTNKGDWVFNSGPRTDSTGKVYYTTDSGAYLPPFVFNPATQQSVPSNPGDYSYGLVPTTTDVGEYCDQFDYLTKTCTRQLPQNGIYQPWAFYDLNGDKSINYGSFAFQFYLEIKDTGNAYFYPFTAKVN